MFTEFGIFQPDLGRGFSQIDLTRWLHYTDVDHPTDASVFEAKLMIKIDREPRYIVK